MLGSPNPGPEVPARSWDNFKLRLILSEVMRCFVVFFNTVNSTTPFMPPTLYKVLNMPTKKHCNFVKLPPVVSKPHHSLPGVIIFNYTNCLLYISPPNWTRDQRYFFLRNIAHFQLILVKKIDEINCNHCKLDIFLDYEILYIPQACCPIDSISLGIQNWAKQISNLQHN